MISINNIYKNFENLKVLKGVSCNIQKGDKVVLTAGVPLGVPGRTNMIRVVEV